MKRDLLSIQDLSGGELQNIVDSAIHLKALREAGTDHALPRKCTLGMIFEKASTRTRTSFEVGMFELGGHALFMNPNDMQLGRGEEVRDTARVLSRYLSLIMIRSYLHETAVELAGYAEIPVINGLSDREHPCQILADIMTMKEEFGTTEGLRVAYIGDSNNVCNSLLLAAPLAGYEMAVASPEGFLPDDDIVTQAERTGARFDITTSPKEAVSGADVIYTDTWVSMGSETEHDARIRAFAGFTVDEALVQHAQDGAKVLHCLPAHRGEEITGPVMDGPSSLIWNQAENRLHAQKALMMMLLE
ncbi:ornithine carbamoyltransferase [Methanogenium organophilum]|uniref:Ornithine carbamoyltransferase n=1 Tax=Methanogenium organophilum TaxID=2199 RepID=A0A9X9S356_METOG|nr:ornithine carbamoyltransferase [Methanogenium organophilum]WAI00902.1 ornithine carbamoyltransferase [Methanogenium organophilum]